MNARTDIEARRSARNHAEQWGGLTGRLRRPVLALGDSERIAVRQNDYLSDPPSAEPLTVWQAIWLPLLVGGCFSSFLVLWLIGSLIGAWIRLKQSRSSRNVGISR